MKEDNFKLYLKEKENVHLNEGFDNSVMSLITKHALNNSNSKKYLRLMYLFFFAGICLGFSIALTFVDKEVFIGNNKFIINKIILQIPLIFIILFIFEKIYRVTLVITGKEKFSAL